MENAPTIKPDDSYKQGRPYEKAIWWIILVIVIALLVLVYSCEIA